MLILRPFLRSKGDTGSAFLDRLATSYESAVLSMSQAHWEQKVYSFGLIGLNSVLDLGCGPGQWLRILAEHNGDVVGTDIERIPLEMALQTVKDSHHIGLTQARAESLCFLAQTFDAVLCYSVLTYTNHESALREINRVTKPGGKVIVGLAGMGYYLKHVVEGVRYRNLAAVRYGLDPILTYWAQSLLGRRSQAITYWTRRRITRLLKDNGFDVVRTIAERKDSSWPDTFLGSYFFFCVEAIRGNL